ncbi:hypothetical protein C7S20_19475 [Christiangramia fulva]|uniref:Uncharacterized protein n=1 Tax=Christiangramia fulva TaxID=2126553 RepID=A0A2R3ZAG5_9FLAO|nr:hypothetical protein [Christiangramia fulva]AVR47257.1 hypothetical protein C7S20_19475 [Christiangramia fulva]
MTSEIANILKTRLSNIDNGLDNQGAPLPNGLLFIDKMAGLIQTAEKAQPSVVEGAFVVSKFPISIDSSYEDCINKGLYKELVPHSKLKGILYFESMGTMPLGLDHGNFKYAVKLRLVCWINNKLIQGDNTMSIAHKLITTIRNSLEKGSFSSGAFNRITCRASNFIDSDYSLFSRYTYPVEIYKYLMYPYEAFGIDYTIEFTIANSCIQELQITAAQC